MDKTPSVLMVIDRFHPLIGGAETQCLHLCKALRDEGVYAQVLTYRHWSESPEYEFIHDIPVIRMPLLRWHIPGFAYLTLFYYLFRHRSEYDILHNHMMSIMTVIVAVISLMFRKPAIVLFGNSGTRNDLNLLRERYFGIKYYLGSWALPKMRYVIAICSTIANELIVDGVPEEKIANIPNGIDRTKFFVATIEQKQQQRELLNLPQDKLIVLRVGTFMEKKAVPVLLDAWEEIMARFPNAMLVSLGGTEVPQEIKKRVSEWGNRVHFVLATDNTLPYYQVADVFVLPSLTEGLSNALLEAQACGLPSVVTDVGGNTDIVKHGENGLVVEANDVRALATALSTIIEDNSLRDSMSRKACTVSASFAMPKIATEYVQLYREMINF